MSNAQKAQDFVTSFMKNLAEGVELTQSLQAVFAKILAEQVVVDADTNVVNFKPGFSTLLKVLTFIATPEADRPDAGYTQEAIDTAADSAATDTGLTLGEEIPTEAPTEEPTDGPTDEPTEEPTDGPTDEPTEEPTDGPTDEPTEEPGIEGNTLELTTGADVIAPLAEGEEAVEGVLNTTENDDVINGLAASYATTTLQKNDQIDGGAGNDTLNVELTSTFGGFTGDGFLKNVETVNLTNTGTGNRVFDAKQVTGVETYNLDGLINLKTLNSADIAVNVANRATTGTVKIEYADKVTEGTEDVLNLGITNLGSAATKEGTRETPEQKVAVEAAGIETLNLNATGANFVTLSTAAVKDINVKGAGSLKLNGLGKDVKGIDASALAGNLDLDLGDNVANVNSIKGGAGDDVILATKGNLKVNSKIDGGAGQDTLVLKGNTTGTLQLDMVGVETIKLDTNTTDLTYSATKTAGLENLIVTGDTSGSGDVTFASMEGDLNVTLEKAVTGEVASDHDGVTTVNITGEGTKDKPASANNTTDLSFSKTANLDVTVAAFNGYTGKISADAAEAASLTLNGKVSGTASLSLGAAESLVINDNNGNNDNNKDADTLILTADKLLDLTLNVNGATKQTKDTDVVVDFTLDSSGTSPAATSLNSLKAFTINTDGVVKAESELKDIADITLTGMGAVKLGKLGDKEAEDSITITAVGLAGLSDKQVKTAVLGLETSDITTGAGNTIDIDVSGVLGAVTFGNIKVFDSEATATSQVAKTGSISITAEGTAGAIEVGNLNAKTVTIDAGEALGTVSGGAITAEEVNFTGSSIKENTINVTEAAKATLVGGIAADTITVNGSNAKVITTAELTGGLGADTFTIAAAGSVTAATIVDGAAIGSATGAVAAANQKQQMVVTITDFKASEDILGATGFNTGIDSLVSLLTDASGTSPASSFGVDKSGKIAVINATGRPNEGKAEFVNGTDADKFFAAFNAFEGVSGLSKDNTQLATVDLNGSANHTAANIALGLLDNQGNFYTISQRLDSGNASGQAMLVKLVGVETLQKYDFAIAADDALLKEVAVDGVGELTSYHLNDTAANLATAGAGVLDGAYNITATDDANVTQAKTIADAENSGTTTYNVADSFANLVNAAKLAVIADKAGIAGATQLVATDLNNAAVTFDNLTADSAATAIKFTDGEATLTATQVADLTTAAIGLTEADVITVTGVDSTNLAAVTAKLDDNDTIVLADDADISGAVVGGDVVNIDLDADTAITVTMTAAQLTAATLSAQADDAITVNTLTGATVAATDATDTFVFADGDTGVTISSFTTGTDKVDLKALSLTAGTVADGTTIVASEIYTITGATADADAAATAIVTALNGTGTLTDANDDDVAYFVVADDNSSAIFKYTAANGATDVTAAELTLVGTFDAQIAAADFVLA